MLKLLGAVCVFGACGTFGIAAWQGLVKHLHALEAMQHALQYLCAEISYHRTPIPVLLEELAHSDNQVCHRVFTEMSKRLKQGNSLSYIWCKTIKELSDELGFSEDTARLLCDAASFLGKYDVQAQLDGIGYIQKRLQQIRDEMEKEVKSRGKLYRTCGLAVGAMMVLILL